MKNPPNLDRMIRLAEKAFDARNDPDQISVTEKERRRLQALHPASLTAEETEDGPIAWMLVVPTTAALMKEFLEGVISERQLLERTPTGASYDALYLCSALVLPEYRRKALATRLLRRAVESVRKDHPIRTLFYWGFSPEGEALAHAVARECGLPLRSRKTPHPRRETSPQKG